MQEKSTKHNFDRFILRNHIENQ